MKLRLSLCLIAWACLTVSSADEVQNEEVTRGKVVSVSHGDTLKVDAQGGKSVLVFLRGTDAPDQGQPFSAESRQALEKLAGKQDVEIHWHEKDRAGRILGDVYVRDNQINHEMIDLGWAWYSDEHFESDELAHSEADAREAGLGLWAGKDPEAPWDFRARQSKKSADAIAAASTRKAASKPKEKPKPAEVDEDRNNAVVLAQPKHSGGTVSVKGHFRTSKTGKTFYVRPYTRSKRK